MGKFAKDNINSTSNISFWSGGAGFQPLSYPGFLCSGSDNTVFYYTVILPLNLMMIFGVTLDVLIIWLITKVST